MSTEENKEVWCMNTKIEDALWADYKKASDLVEGLSIGDNNESYKMALEDRDKVRTELIKMEQMKNEEQTQLLQVKNESKWNWIKFGMTLTTLGINLAFSSWAMRKTFEFDQEGTVTSTLGRGILNNSIPKLFKR